MRAVAGRTQEPFSGLFGTLYWKLQLHQREVGVSMASIHTITLRLPGFTRGHMPSRTLLAN